MSIMTVESVLQLIDQLSPAEQSKLKQLMKEREIPQSQPEPANEAQPDRTQNGVPTQRLKPRPMPDSTRERQWLAKHKREYIGQWVSLDGDRLIAASPNHDEVWAAAEADGAYLPLFTFVEDPDKLYIGL